VTSGGALKCWGWNGYGQLGDDNAPNDAHTPVSVVGISSGVTTIASGSKHTCAITSGGAIKCWGWNEFGLLGDNNAPNDAHTPVSVAGLSSGGIAVAAGGSHTCGVTSGGEAKCWGANDRGQLGDNNAPNDAHTPVSVVGF